jgi:hypothetical protein
VAEYDKVIPPGKEGKVEVKIDHKKIFPGMVEKSFTVLTNDPDNKQFFLVVQGNVKKVLDVSRDLSWAGFADENFKLEATITDLLSTPIDITGYKWDQSSIDKGIDQRVGVKIETIEKGRKYLLKIWKKKELIPDRFVSDITLLTDYPKMKEKTLKLSVVVAHDVELHPDRLYFGEIVLPPGATRSYERSFSIVAARGDSLKVLKVVPNRKDITVNMKELQPGKSYQGTVSIRPESRIGQYMGSIKIYTNYPNYKELNLDIVGSVRVSDESSTGGVTPGKVGEAEQSKSKGADQGKKK